MRKFSFVYFFPFLSGLASLFLFVLFYIFGFIIMASLYGYLSSFKQFALLCGELILFGLTGYLA